MQTCCARNQTVSNISSQNAAMSHMFWLQAEQKRREKARKDATNQGKPLFDEDGQRKGILDKYDEDEQAEGMEIDTHGAAAGKLTKQEEIRRKLAAGWPPSLCLSHTTCIAQWT